MHSYELSNEIQPLKRSVMRDLLKLAVSPDIISFAGGLPASDYLPVQEFQACLKQVLESQGAQAMQYAPMHNPLRDWLAGYMQRRGVACERENIFITGGCQQGLAILSRLFLDPGSHAVIEGITFTGIQQVTSGRGAAIRAVPTDLQSGVDIEALEEAFQRPPRPRLAVLIPDFHNPLGVSITWEKRRRIAELAARYRVPVIEDDPYSPLRFEGEMLPPIKSFDREGYVFYLGSFSKMLAPAMRLGWIVAPTDLIPKITVIRESLDLESSTLLQRAVTMFLAEGMLEKHLTTFNPRNKARRDAMLDALQAHFTGLATWTHPEGGLFTWVTLPPEMDSGGLFRQAVDRKVAYIPGPAFAVNGGHKNTLRLNFSNAKPEEIREGIARLAGVFKGKRK